MAETIVINPLTVTGGTTKKKGSKRMARRRTTTTRKPKVIRVTRKVTPQSVAKQVAWITSGMVAAGLLNKAVKIPQKHLVAIGGAIALIIFGKKILGPARIPMGVGMGATGVFTWLIQNPQLKGILSDYLPSCYDPYHLRGYLPGHSLQQPALGDYWKDPHLAGISVKKLDFSDI